MPSVLKAMAGGLTGVWLLRALVRRGLGPRAPSDAREFLNDVQPPTQQEIELYVPEEYRNLGSDWDFTRGKVLTFSERSKSRRVGSLHGFDLDESYSETYSVYSGVYGYLDHERRLQTFAMKPTENDRLVRPGRSFIICFNRRRPRVHNLFRLVRLSHPTPR